MSQPNTEKTEKNRKLIERLLIFFIGIPAIFALVFLLPNYNHLAFNIVVALFSSIGAVEISLMLNKKNIQISKIEAFILGSLAPLSAILSICFGANELIIEALFILGALWVLAPIAFTKKEEMMFVSHRLIGRLSLIIYPGFFMRWTVKMSGWESSFAIFLFLLVVFINDSAAWLFGSLFGKKNKGIVAASPNKSVAGFIGGMLGSVLICVLAAAIFPSVFPSPKIPLVLNALLLGLFTGIFATLGDLSESAIKRSCEIKDSGNAILGRGGILDSIDSIALAAPVYYLLFNCLFNI